MRWITRSSLLLALLTGCLGCGGGAEPAWTEHELGTDAEFKDIFFLDRFRGWMVGGGYPVDGGIVASTLDGGLTWSFRTGLVLGGPRPHTVYLQAVQFLDARTGFVASGSGQILRTVDAGVHWHMVYRGGRRLSDLQFVDDRYGWAVGDSILLGTIDGGESWLPLMPADSSRRSFGRAIQFVDRRFGWLVGTAGGILRSTDGGSTWEEVSRRESGRPDLWGLSFVDTRRGWVVGEGGTILRTTDGGGTWLPQTSGTDSLLIGVRFLDPMRGWASGYDRSDSSSIVLYTDDGGVTWNRQLRVEGEALFALEFAESGHGWAVGERVRPYPQRLLLYEPPPPTD